MSVMSAESPKPVTAMTFLPNFLDSPEVRMMKTMQVAVPIMLTSP